MITAIAASNFVYPIYNMNNIQEYIQQISADESLAYLLKANEVLLFL